MEQEDKPKPPQVVIPGAFGDARLPMAWISLLLLSFGEVIMAYIWGMRGLAEPP